MCLSWLSNIYDREADRDCAMYIDIYGLYNPDSNSPVILACFIMIYNMRDVTCVLVQTEEVNFNVIYFLSYLLVNYRLLGLLPKIDILFIAS